MQGYKAVKDFTYCECLEFLKQNPSSQYAKQVSERRDVCYNILKSEDDRLFACAKTISDYGNYLKTYPKGCYPGLHRRDAQLRIDDLFYNQNKDSKKGCENYLERFPKGTHTKEANLLVQKYYRARNMKIALSIVLLTAIAGIICYLNYYPTSYVEVSGKPNVSQYGEEISLNISTDAEYGAIYVSSSNNWIYVKKFDNISADLEIEPNCGSERTGHITVTVYTTFFGSSISSISKTYNIHQSSGKATYMNISTSTLRYDKYGNAEEKASFTLQCDGVSQKVSSDNNWIKVVRSSGSTHNKSNYSVTVDKNIGDGRNGKIVINSQPYEKVITVYQKSGLASYLSIDKHDIVCKDASGLEDGYYYRVSISTDGVSWTASGPSWIELKENTSSLEIVPKSNDGKIRTGTVYVHSNNGHTESISIKQNGEPSNLSVSPSTWRPGTSSTNKSFTITNDSFYSISARSDENWLSASVSGNNVKVYCNSNSSLPRYGTVDIRCGNSMCTITIKQDGYKDCSRCSGTGKVTCTANASWGTDMWGNTVHKVYQQTSYYDFYLNMWVPTGQWVDCSKCRGTGRITCPSCGGDKRYVTSY